MTDILKLDLYDIRNFSQIKGRLLGIDFGTKRIGVAVSDFGQEIATPLSVLENNRLFFYNVKKIIEEYMPSGIVIGIPSRMDGSLGNIAEDIVQFAEEIKKNFDLPIAFWEERFSSKLAEDVLLAFDLSRGKRKKVIDKVAAAHILQNALDFLKFND